MLRDCIYHKKSYTRVLYNHLESRSMNRIKTLHGVIFRSFQLVEDNQVYGTVKGCFATQFVGRTNVIFKRARFNKHFGSKQESMINLIKSLYMLADTCQFGTLKEEIIEDRIIVGISNAMLSQKLMQDDTLTLDKAVKQAKSSELVKEHHEILKEDG